MMAIFGKRAPQPTPEEIAAQQEADRLRQAWEKLDKAINANPIFAICTFDGLSWIEPFSGAIIPTPFGRVSEARKFYADNNQWRSGRTKPAVELQRIRWLQWIRENLRSDDRLRIFNADSQWLNPHTGTYAPGVTRIDGKVTPETLKAMADDLVRQGAKSPDCFKDLRSLKDLVGAHREDDSGMVPIIGGEDFNISIIKSEESHSESGSGIRPTGTARIAKRRDGISGVFNDPALNDLRSLLQEQNNLKEQQIAEAGSRELPAPDLEHAEDLDRARNVQRNMLGKIPNLPNYEIAVHYEPYDAIGGDFYEICTLKDKRVLILLGDVTGHGVQAALVTSSMIKSLRYITKTESDLVEILAELNDSAREDLVTGQFVTVWAGILDVENNVIETVCAGHHPAILANPNKDVVVERIGNKGMAIGLMSSTILRKQLATTHYQLEPGDLLFQYTDGITEMQHPELGEFGDFRAMGGVLYHLENCKPQALIDGIAQMAHEWTGCEPDDDVTMLAIRLIPEDELADNDENSLEAHQ